MVAISIGNPQSAEALNLKEHHQVTKGLCKARKLKANVPKRCSHKKAGDQSHLIHVLRKKYKGYAAMEPRKIKFLCYSNVLCTTALSEEAHSSNCIATFFFLIAIYFLHILGKHLDLGLSCTQARCDQGTGHCQARAPSLSELLQVMGHISLFSCRKIQLLSSNLQQCKMNVL